MSLQSEVRSFVRSSFASYAGLEESVIFSQALTLSDVIARSDKMVNSIDLLEVFAKVGNAVNAKFGVRTRLQPPALTVEVSVVADEFTTQLVKLLEERNAG